MNRKVIVLLAALVMCFIITGCESTTESTSEEGKKLIAYTVDYQEKEENGIVFYEAEGETYQYRITLVGRSSNGEYDSYYIVLTNDETITFKEVDRRYYGSDMSKWGDYYIVEFGLISE